MKRPRNIENHTKDIIRQVTRLGVDSATFYVWLITKLATIKLEGRLEVEMYLNKNVEKLEPRI